MSQQFTMHVLDRAWVIAGIIVDPGGDGEMRVLREASVVRVWGTDAGIGQLNAGVRPNTALDPILGEVSINPARILYEFPLENWNPKPHPAFPKEKDRGAKSRIIVLNRAWVLSGDILDMNRHEIQLVRSDVVRLWGTTRGIGELAEGPTVETKLDPIPPQVTIHMRHMIFMFDARGWPDRTRTFGEYQQKTEQAGQDALASISASSGGAVGVDDAPSE